MSKIISDVLNHVGTGAYNTVKKPADILGPKIWGDRTDSRRRRYFSPFYYDPTIPSWATKNKLTIRNIRGGMLAANLAGIVVSHTWFFRSSLSLTQKNKIENIDGITLTQAQLDKLNSDKLAEIGGAKHQEYYDYFANYNDPNGKHLTTFNSLSKDQQNFAGEIAKLKESDATLGTSIEKTINEERDKIFASRLADFKKINNAYDPENFKGHSSYEKLDDAKYSEFLLDHYKAKDTKITTIDEAVAHHNAKYSYNPIYVTKDDVPVDMAVKKVNLSTNKFSELIEINFNLIDALSAGTKAGYGALFFFQWFFTILSICGINEATKEATTSPHHKHSAPPPDQLRAEQDVVGKHQLLVPPALNPVHEQLGENGTIRRRRAINHQPLQSLDPQTKSVGHGMDQSALATQDVMQSLQAHQGEGVRLLQSTFSFGSDSIMSPPLEPHPGATQPRSVGLAGELLGGGDRTRAGAGGERRWAGSLSNSFLPPPPPAGILARAGGAGGWPGGGDTFARREVLGQQPSAYQARGAFAGQSSNPPPAPPSLPLESAGGNLGGGSRMQGKAGEWTEVGATDERASGGDGVSAGAGRRVGSAVTYGGNPGASPRMGGLERVGQSLTARLIPGQAPQGHALREGQPGPGQSGPGQSGPVRM